MRYFPVIVVGGGLAGLRAAIEVNMHNIQVCVLSRVHPVRSHSLAAQGGINGALGNHARGVYDSPEKHAFDTVKGSDYLGDQDAIIRMCNDAPLRIYEMEHWGCPFSRTSEGKIAQRPFGGAGFPRTAYAEDKTGHVLLHTLYEQIVKFEHSSERADIVVLDEMLVTSLVVDDGRCVGVVALNLKSGQFEAFQSDAVIFATGGSGRIYSNSTNALISTALGIYIPFREGAPLKDMEFIQFHPTTLIGTNILMTEGCRGEGGFLLNNKGERFLANYEDSKNAMEVAPRDIVARNIQREIDAGRGFENSYVHLDIRHLGEKRINERLPGIRELCIKFANIDPVVDPIPVQPGQHYTMGGIDTDINGASEIKGLYAAGECACVSVHGANRLGGNSLLETIVYGAIAGRSCAEYVSSLSKTKIGTEIIEARLRDEERRAKEIVSKDGDYIICDVRDKLAQVMAQKVGLFRSESQLKSALEDIQEAREKFAKVKFNSKSKSLSYNYEFINYLETEANICISEVVVRGAIERRESRGSHFRIDYPKRDDAQFLKHTIARYSKGEISLSYKPVKIVKWEPKERKY
ncbi:MAG: FAD-binding protein [Deltaproteobacteria bacterium]|nr:FAD-binding protein [Deltaproteobacteria bacterium]